MITATDTADQFRTRFNTFSLPNSCVEDLYVIDCSESGRDKGVTETPTCMSATPTDLTGFGICLSKAYKEFGTPGSRVSLLDNLPTFRY